jgi:hypothetical protein
MEKKIDSNNIGYKLLKSMGWKEGNPLGNKREGLIEPIKIDIESKISKNQNKNYKGKKKSCKNKITLSNFKSKLYNTKEDKSNVNNIINDKFKLNQINLNSENPTNYFNKENHLQNEKKLRKNISLLLNIIYNYYYIDDNQNLNYTEIKNENKINNDIDNENNINKNINMNFKFGFDENINNKYPINENLYRFIEVSDELRKISFIESNHSNINNNNSNYIELLRKFCLNFEEFLIGKHLKALTEEVNYYETYGFLGNDKVNVNGNVDIKLNENNNINDYSRKFCEIYLNNMEYITNQIKFILSNKLFYCDICSIKFECKEDLIIHEENECGENDDLSDN